MRSLKVLTLGLAWTAVAALAAELTVQNARLYGPNGAVEGKIVMFNNRMAFIDDNQPDLSFVIPKSDIRSATWEGGRLTINLAHPYSSSLGANQSTVILTMPDTTSASSFITWMGVPVSGFTAGEADRAATPPNTTQVADVRFDVKNGDQKGKLIVAPDELIFESLTDANHSRRWKYADIREFTHSDHEIKLEPYHGDKYKFQFNNKAMLQTAYDLISNKIVNARVNR
jgi:hypothetical protein